jgi:PAS domain S-box-containing protein
MDDLLDSAPGGFLQFSDDGIILHANRTLTALLGYNGPEDLQGKKMEAILPVASRIFYQTHFFPILKLHAEAHEIYLSLRSRTGNSIPVLINAARRQRSTGVVNECILIPIRQRSEYEDEILRAKKVAEDSVRAKDEFLAVISHELRTPLNAILGWSRLVRDARLNAELLDQGLDSIERNAKAQAQLIEDILDFSRITAGKLRLDVSQVELSDVIQVALDVVRPAAEAKGIRLQCVLDNVAAPISGDPHRLQQVLWNLLSNAVKFTPKGGRVQVRLQRINSHVEIVVSDTGQGISADFLPFVFERFRQADGSTTRRHGGLGLGMAITRQIVELHGGTIRVQSGGQGQGSTFVVELPVVIMHEPESAATQEPVQDEIVPNGVDQQALPTLNGLHVLVVDDDRDSRELLTTLLSRSGASVTAAASVGEALERVRRDKPGFLISDIEMPGEDGYSFIRQVRAMEKQEGGWTPAIALTAHARPSDRMQALSAGFQMHLTKPIAPAELIVIIAGLCQRHVGP